MDQSRKRPQINPRRRSTTPQHHQEEGGGEGDVRTCPTDGTELWGAVLLARIGLRRVP